MSKSNFSLKWYEKFTYQMVTNTELFFYKLGFKVASKPWTTIAICWGIILIGCLGFLRFHNEKNPLKLWVPPNSEFMKDSKILMSKFQKAFREQAVIITAPDVLTPDILLKVFELTTRIKEVVSPEGISWNDVCFKIPDVDLDAEETLKQLGRNAIDFDPSVVLNSVTYCNMIESMGEACFENSILELWKYDEFVINSLTKEKIIEQVNKYKTNPILSNLKNYEELLGNVKRNESGHIIGASAMHIIYYTNLNFTAVNMQKVGNLAGTADWALEDGLLWESAYRRVLESEANNAENFTINYMAARDFGDVTEAVMFQEVGPLIIGITIMIIYVEFVLSKFNCVEARILLGFLGLLTVLMAFIFGCALCSLLGVSYGPIHASLPFLFMGLGVDDMFVILACWENLDEQYKTLPLPEKIGHLLKHAGVSITITTFTDVIAFIIGSSTILPSLESYCIFAGVGVSMIFVFEVTFFIACFTLDQIRLESNRNSAIIFYKHDNFKPNECSKKNFTNIVFHKIYSKLILTPIGKIIVILITISCLVVSLESIFKLEARFDPNWFVPEDTELGNYLDKRVRLFPHLGFDSGLYFGSVNYSQELLRIEEAENQLKNSKDIGIVTSSWVQPFINYIKHTFHKDVHKENLTTNEFNLFLSKFLFSPRGAKYQANFVFQPDLECGLPAPNITISSIDFRLNIFHKPSEYLPAMHRLIDISKSTNFTSGDRFATAWSKIFASWVTDELIDQEVSRNLQLALLCVMGCTILLVANMRACVCIFVCVLLTMVNVCGFMQRWGVSIDLVSCIGLELAIGLCVDYATHIAHTFLTTQGSSRQERSLKAVSSIGAAVFYGGLSTFLGVGMLGFSRAYSFRIFFKIFVLVITFGLFHGIVFLPVILSVLGPLPYTAHKPLRQTDTALNEVNLE